ncbi:repressor of RNA polymerase III transcription maf1 isoform X2 [Macadamia integrifolia]|uniref:repressor of RNA polymerase III transcription maf1 isoform X2 n=1 Tax=Macadamia integrifolia TaxID=60698 RepID=UPI001C527307|nr:repressor of RNA polymerase III transcription maf1 isoform X2 [Macadamia integrifolia]
MKFLEHTSFDSINDFLNHVNLGECTVSGNLEAYSCKHTGTDRRLSFSLENQILDSLGQSSDSDRSSPGEILSSRSSRKTLIYLVLTLSHIYPDYDFSAVRAHLFFREEGWESFKLTFDTYMFETAKVCEIYVLMVLRRICSIPPLAPTWKEMHIHMVSYIFLRQKSNTFPSHRQHLCDPMFREPQGMPMDFINIPLLNMQREPLATCHPK